MSKRGKTYRRYRKKSTYISKGTGSKIIHTSYGDIAKKRVSRSMGVKKINLEEDTAKLIRKANARLDSLQRRFGKGTWSSKTLMNKLSQKNMKLWNKSTGKIKTKNLSKLNKTQLTALNKATRNFLKSKTSTRAGIEDIRRQQIKKIQERKKLEEDIDLSYEEAEDLYEMFGDEDFEFIADKIGSSFLQSIIEDAIDDGDSESDFLNRLKRLGSLDTNDLDIREKAINIYNKYVA